MKVVKSRLEVGCRLQVNEPDDLVTECSGRAFGVGQALQVKRGNVEDRGVNTSPIPKPDRPEYGVKVVALVDSRSQKQRVGRPQLPDEGVIKGVDNRCQVHTRREIRKRHRIAAGVKIHAVAKEFQRADAPPGVKHHEPGPGLELYRKHLQSITKKGGPKAASFWCWVSWT